MQQSGVFQRGQPHAGVARLVNGALGALLGGVVTFWGLRLGYGSAPAPVPEPAVQALEVDAQALARALGAAVAAPQPAAQGAAPPAASPSRYVLLGVLAGRDSGAGAAVIAVGSAPPRPFVVGAPVDGGLVLQSLAPHAAYLAPGMDAAASVTLHLALPPSLLPEKN